VIRDPLARLPQIDMAYHVAPGNTPENYAAQQLALILGQGQSSRFYQHLVKEKQLATQIGIFADTRIGTSQLQISANPRPGVKVEDLERGIDEEIAAAVKDGVTADELAKAQTQLLRRFIDQRRSTLRTAILIGDYAVKFNDPNLINTVIDKQHAVTLADVNAVAKKYLDRDQRTVIVTLPAGDDARGTKGAQ
jgi:predicted Zn-dependent peptidase